MGLKRDTPVEIENVVALAPRGVVQSEILRVKHKTHYFLF